jgi:hypothetical protein
LDKPINVEQSGEIRHDRGFEQVLEENTNSSHVNNEAQTDDVNAQNLEENTETGESQSLL